MRYVRWLGAYGQGTSLTEAAAWEHSQTERQVAAEPLWRGHSLIPRAKIGLVVDEDRSIFASGWTHDAWTGPDACGVLRHSTRGRGFRLRRFKDENRFAAAWRKMTPQHHGEVAFDSPVYKAVVVKATATEHGKARAARLANQLGLPLQVLNKEIHLWLE